MNISKMNLPQMKKAFKLCRVSLGRINTLKDSAFRTVERSKLFSKMNRLRAAINKAVIEYRGVMINHTKKHGVHFVLNGVVSKAFVSVQEAMICINRIITNRLTQSMNSSPSTIAELV